MAASVRRYLHDGRACLVSDLWKRASRETRRRYASIVVECLLGSGTIQQLAFKISNLTISCTALTPARTLNTSDEQSTRDGMPSSSPIKLVGMIPRI